MKKYRLYQVDSFTKELFKGNPAGVVLNADGLSDLQMQKIAREFNNSETAFILSPDAEDHEVRIRFFTPSTEVPSCGHATIAAHYIRAKEMNLNSCTVIQKIGIGILPVDIEKSGEEYKIIMTQGEPEIGEPFTGEVKDRIISALGLVESDLEKNCPVQIVSTGHSKVLVGIRSRTKLNNLYPDMSGLKKISADIGCNGYFVFTFDSENTDALSYGRMFAPAIGIPEDPVTGNANGPLGAYVVKNGLIPLDNKTVTFKGCQGEAIGRLGTVEVWVDHNNGIPEKVRIGGNAVTVFKTGIEL